MSFEHLLPPSWKQQVGSWLAEDAPSFDYGGYVVGDVLREAFLFGKGSQTAVLAGSPFVDEIFVHLDCKYVCLIVFFLLCNFSSLSQSIIRVEWHVKEGDTFEPVKHIATVKGKARFLLLGERVALNLLARCSGIATKSFNPFYLVLTYISWYFRSKRIKDLARSYGFNGIIAGTRKTTPGMFLCKIPEMSFFDLS